MKKINASTNELKNAELDKIINDAMEASDIIAFKSILDEYHIKYDDNIKTLEELKNNSLKNCSDDISKKVIEKFDSFKNQSLSTLKDFDPNNLTKFKAEQVIKNIGNIASPIAQTLTKSALTIAMYQGLYMLPLPLKFSIAGATFATKRLPKILKGSKEALKKAKEEGGVVKNISKKVIATVLAGGAGVGAITLLNYISKGAIPDKVLNKLPGIKESLRFISPSNLRKAVLVTTGIAKGVDAYNLRNQETALFQPIIKGFFVAKGMKIDEEIKSFKDIEKYVNKLDDQGKYEFKQYLNKCTSMKKMADSPEEKVKKVGKTVIKLVSDAFETASYLSLIQPLTLTNKNNNGNNELKPKPQPEPVVVQDEENVKIKVPQKQPVISNEPTFGNEKSPDLVLHSETIPETLPTPNMKATPNHNINIPENIEDIQPEIEADPEDMKRIVERFKKSSPMEWNQILDGCLENAEKLLGVASIGAAAAALYEIISTCGPALVLAL